MKDNSSAPGFEDIARLIVPTNTPPWLVEHFEQWAPSLMLHGAVLESQPTKATMKSLLGEAGKAAAVLDKALGCDAFTEFLEHEGRARIKNVGGFRRALQTIAQHAAIAASSPVLSETTGKTKRGRGKAKSADAIAAKTYCALMIAEAWMHLHGGYPGSRNRKAAAAADALWGIARGEVSGWGKDRLNGWRYYFDKALAAPEEDWRKEYQRRLRDAAHWHELVTAGQRPASESG